MPSVVECSVEGGAPTVHGTLLHTLMVDKDVPALPLRGVFNIDDESTDMAPGGLCVRFHGPGH